MSQAAPLEEAAPARSLAAAGADGLPVWPAHAPLRRPPADADTVALLARALGARIRPHLAAARIAPATLPGCDGLRLLLLNDDFPHDALSPHEMNWALNEPSYWMFCWASGLAQARQILAQPALVRGRTVLDLSLIHI